MSDTDKNIEFHKKISEVHKLLNKIDNPDMRLMIDCFAKVDWMWSYLNAVLDTAVARKEMKESERSYTIEELRKRLEIE